MSTAKTIVILNGSPRKNGNVVHMLKAVAEGASNKYEIKWFDVCYLNIQPCLGCMKCRPDKECVLPEDDALTVGRIIKEASALVVGTPTYWGNMSGPLKMFFDRNVPVFEYVDKGFPLPRQKGKKAAVVTSCASPWPYSLIQSQAMGAVKATNTILRSAGYRIIGSLILSNTMSHKNIPAKTLAKARMIGLRF